MHYFIVNNTNFIYYLSRIYLITSLESDKQIAYREDAECTMVSPPKVRQRVNLGSGSTELAAIHCRRREIQAASNARCARRVRRHWTKGFKVNILASRHKFSARTLIAPAYGCLVFVPRIQKYISKRACVLKRVESAPVDLRKRLLTPINKAHALFKMITSFRVKIFYRFYLENSC